jgi:hypothetical protein
VNVTIRFGDESLIVPREVFEVATDSAVRMAIDRMTSPLKREGIDTLDFLEEEPSERQTKGLPVSDEYMEHLSKEDLPALTFEPVDGEVLLDSTREAVLENIRLSFKPEHKWGFTDGSSKVSAKIQDFVFWERIQSGQEKFAKGDQILVKLRTRTYRTTAGELKSEHFIVEVVRHIPPATQLMLPS